MVGIVSYGFYIPLYRIKISQIAKVWGKRASDIERSLMVKEKSVAGIDEDSATIGYQAGVMVFEDLKIDRKEIKVVFFGTETPPYSVNPTATIVSQFLGINGDYLASDLEFACKAGTGALIAAVSLIRDRFTKYGLVIAADKAVAKPDNPLEYTVGSGGVGLLLGETNVCVEVVDLFSFSSDTPDFWRREGIKYPSHGGRFTGKPGYFYHITQASKGLLDKTGLKPRDFNQAVFHMPNGKFPRQMGKLLGFTPQQLEKSLIVTKLGNFYTASALMGLVAVLETAGPGELIFFCSYGSGAGADAMVLRTTQRIRSVQKKRQISKVVNGKRYYIDYPTYLKFTGVIG